MNWKSYFLTLFLLSTFMLSVRILLVTPYKVVAKSLSPQLLPGDYIFINRIGSSSREYRRGDIIISGGGLEKAPLQIYRIVAKPGDFVTVVNGQLFVNDKESFFTPKSLDGREPSIVPPELYYVLKTIGDSQKLLSLPQSQIQGRAFLVWFSVEQRDTISEASWVKIRWPRIGILL